MKENDLEEGWGVFCPGSENEDEKETAATAQRKMQNLPDRGVTVINYTTSRGAYIIAARGSIIEYSGDVAVNSATPDGNKGEAKGLCVDKAFQDKGGQGMIQARNDIPAIAGQTEKIPVGTSFATQPGMCLTSAVIHTTAPDYAETKNEDEADDLLREAYRSALSTAYLKGDKSVGLCLLSAGQGRGTRTIEDVVRIAVDIVVAVAQKGMEVTLVAKTGEEVYALNEACKSLHENVISQKWTSQKEERRRKEPRR